MKGYRILALGCCVVTASAAQAQRQSQRQASVSVPTSLQPPAGMCRILLDGVAPAQQPAPTTCESAIKNRPANGRVIFGSDFPRPDAKKSEADTKRGDLGLKGVVPPPATGDAKPVDPKALDKKADDKKSDPRKPDPKAPPRKPPVPELPPDGF